MPKRSHNCSMEKTRFGNEKARPVLTKSRINVARKMKTMRVSALEGRGATTKGLAAEKTHGRPESRKASEVGSCINSLGSSFKDHRQSEAKKKEGKHSGRIRGRMTGDSFFADLHAKRTEQQEGRKLTHVQRSVSKALCSESTL
jgi:hypothetical protein